MRVLVVTDRGGVSEFYRAVTPYRLLADTEQIELKLTSGMNPGVVDRLDEFDVVVFSRADSAIHHALLLHAKMAGKRVIFDIDDNLLILPPSIVYGHAWHEPGTGKITPRSWYLRKNIELADVLTVTTKALGDQLCDTLGLRGSGDYVVLPNQVLMGDWQVEPLSDKPKDEIWVGWWGIYQHWDDWREVAPHIEPVILAHPKAHLVILGMPELAQLFPSLCESERFTAAPFIPPSKLDGYRATVKAFDVALAPTWDHPFNESKSDLKLLQYGIAGVPVIASPVTYSAWRGYAMLPDAPDEWGDALEHALNHPDEMRRQAEKLQAIILSTRTYDVNYHLWLEMLNGG